MIRTGGSNFLEIANQSPEFELMDIDENEIETWVYTHQSGIQMYILYNENENETNENENETNENESQFYDAIEDLNTWTDAYECFLTQQGFFWSLEEVRHFRTLTEKVEKKIPLTPPERMKFMGWIDELWTGHPRRATFVPDVLKGQLETVELIEDEVYCNKK